MKIKVAGNTVLQFGKSIKICLDLNRYYGCSIIVTVVPIIEPLAVTKHGVRSSRIGVELSGLEHL